MIHPDESMNCLKWWVSRSHFRYSARSMGRKRGVKLWQSQKKLGNEGRALMEILGYCMILSCTWQGCIHNRKFNTSCEILLYKCIRIVQQNVGVEFMRPSGSMLLASKVPDIMLSSCSASGRKWSLRSRGPFISPCGTFILERKYSTCFLHNM